MTHDALISSLINGVRVGELGLPDEFLVQLQLAILLFIFIDAGENGRIEAHLHK